MVFNIVVSLENLKSLKGKNYSIMVADTVAVKSEGPDVLTAKVAREYGDVSYSLEVANND